MRLPPQVIHAKPPQRQKPEAEPKHLLATKDMGRLADRILYMDKQVIVIDKPPGLATQGGSGLTKHVDGMLDSLQYEKPTRPKLVHRLDRDTSGVLLIARTALAASGLSASLALRDTSKVYWALTRGVPKQKNGVVKGALAKEGGHGPHGRDERMAIGRGRRGGRQVRPHRICRDGDGGHRIRLGGGAAHHRAHPPDPRASGQPGHAHRGRLQIWRHRQPRAEGDIADKLHLHARSIDIGRPDGGRLQATAPLPPHMVKSWKLLGFDPDDKRDPFPPEAKEEPKAHAARKR